MDIILIGKYEKLDFLWFNIRSKYTWYSNLLCWIKLRIW